MLHELYHFFHNKTGQKPLYDSTNVGLCFLCATVQTGTADTGDICRITVSQGADTTVNHTIAKVLLPF
jgi:hypothetical protein